MHGAQDLHLAAWATLAGSLLFCVGAAIAPEPWRVFTGDRALYLDVLHRRSGRWQTMNALMVAGVAGTAAGLIGLGGQLPQPFGIGAVLFTVGGVLWIGTLVSRSTVDVNVAHRLAGGTDVPASFDAWQQATGGWFKAYLFLAYAGTVLTGIALNASTDVPRYAGWFAIVFGSVAFVANATGRPSSEGFGPWFEPPFMVHLATLVMAIALIRWEPGSGGLVAF
jgi:hypothetical protein